MASDTHDVSRDQFMLSGSLADQGYDWWWHSFTGRNARTGEERAFFVEFFSSSCNLTKILITCKFFLKLFHDPLRSRRSIL